MPRGTRWRSSSPEMASQSPQPARSKRLAQAVHILAIAAGVLTIVASSAPALGLPAQVSPALGVLTAVLTYVANQLPTLGAS